MVRTSTTDGSRRNSCFCSCEGRPLSWNDRELIGPTDYRTSNIQVTVRVPVHTLSFLRSMSPPRLAEGLVPLSF